MKKIRNLFIVTMMFLFCFNMKSFAEPATWVQNKSLPVLENGVTNWSYIDTNRMYVKSSWKEINSKWYYFNENGFMLASTTTPDGYLVNNNGEWVNGPGASNNNKYDSWNVDVNTINSVIDEGVKLKEQAVLSGKSVSIPQMINVTSNHAEYSGGGNPVITLDKSGNSYNLTIGTRLTSSLNQKGLYQILRLIGGDTQSLYNTIYDSYEGSGNQINYNDFVNISNHQIKAINNGNTITYVIK